MNLYEHQAKELLAGAGIPVPRSALAASAAAVRQAASDVGLPCVVKAQVLRGGRGKAGLIQVANSAEEASEKAAAMFASPHQVARVLIEERLEIEQELYLSMTLEPASAMVTVMVSPAGGVDIEETAASAPDQIHRERIDVFHGLMPFNIRNLLTPLGLSKDTGKAFGKIVGQLYGVFGQHDASLAEINPLVVAPDGTCVAADAKMTIDDNSLWRQPFEHTVEEFTDEVEYEAAREGIPYVKFDGDIGLMCAGAGLTNTVSDLIRDFGGEPANFLEFGGPNYRKARQAMALTLKADPKVVLIVTFGTIARADVMAEGIVEAIAELNPTVPIVTAIRGTGEEKSNEILRRAGLEPMADTEEAVKKAIALAQGGAA